MRGIKLLSFAILFGSLSMASANHHEEETITLDNLADAFGWDFDATPVLAEKVADGLYVLFGVGGNIGVSIGNDGVLVVDDQFPQVMGKIEDAIEKIGGNGVDYAVNTHWHFDHAEGNISLGPKGTKIVAHVTAREDMAAGGIVNLVIAKYKQQPYPENALPKLTYEDGMTLYFNNTAIDLKHYGIAHTRGDSAVFFRKQNAVHLGDVFNNSGYPFVDVDSGGGIDGMISFCQKTLDEIGPDGIIIPGHGPVTDAAALERYIFMLQSVRDRVAKMIDQGMSLDEVVAAKPTGEFDQIYGPESASLGFVNRVYTSLIKSEQI